MNRRKFLSYVGCGCGSLILPSCTTAPITDRKQLKIVSEARLNAQAAQIYEKVKEKEKMSNDTKTLNEIKEIGLGKNEVEPFTMLTFDDSPKRGLRIDHIMVATSLMSKVVETGIDYQARSMEKPSDHCLSQSLGAGVAPVPFVGSYVMAPIAITYGGDANQKINYLGQAFSELGPLLSVSYLLE